MGKSFMLLLGGGARTTAKSQGLSLLQVEFPFFLFSSSSTTSNNNILRLSSTSWSLQDEVDADTIILLGSDMSSPEHKRRRSQSPPSLTRSGGCMDSGKEVHHELQIDTAVTVEAEITGDRGVTRENRDKGGRALRPGKTRRWQRRGTVSG